MTPPSFLNNTKQQADHTWAFSGPLTGVSDLDLM